MEIDMTYQLKVIQQSLEQEEAEHKTTKARLADKNKIYESIEEAKSEAMKGMHCEGYSRNIFQEPSVSL
jgi:Rho-associated protein kinase 2